MRSSKISSRLWWSLCALVSLLLVGSWPTGTEIWQSSHAGANLGSWTQTVEPVRRRVNAPYDVPGEEAAIFWFGRVTPTENSADVRVGYREKYLYVHVAIIDRRLWYDTSPTPDDLTSWDAVSLYLDTNGDGGNVPDNNAYRFDAQLVWWQSRENYQTAYIGDGNDWMGATMPFTTTSFWAGDVPNTGVDDRGWALIYYIPFDSLGLEGPPTPNTQWSMAISVHDRDDIEGTAISDKVWPESMDPQQPTTWGQLVFGMPNYNPPPAIASTKVTIRQGIDEEIVMDGDVGGSSVCGSPAAPDYFPTWGELNYTGKEFLNIQNLGEISEWPCFSKYYVTFPLDTLPAGEMIISATLTLYQVGNAGQGYEPGPQPSLIQVLTVGENWDEATLTWNNAPLAQENIAATWVEPLEEPPDWPGIPRQWDVSSAVAESYAAQEPLRLALYEADWARHSGKYFLTSDSPAGQPRLTVMLGQAISQLQKSATPTSGREGEPITFSLRFLGNGSTLTLTDTLPNGLATPVHYVLTGTDVAPSFDCNHHRLTWTDTPPEGHQVSIQYITTIITSSNERLVNRAELGGSDSGISIATATIIANPQQHYLPLISR